MKQELNHLQTRLGVERQQASQHQLGLQAKVTKAQAHIKVCMIITHPQHAQMAMLFSAALFNISKKSLSPFVFSIFELLVSFLNISKAWSGAFLSIFLSFLFIINADD